MAHVYSGTPDDRQTDDSLPPSRFRPRHRMLTEDETALHDLIKLKAQELELLINQVPNGRDQSLAFTHLEDAVMRAVRALTA